MCKPDISARILAALTFPMATDELVSQLGERTKHVREAVDKLHRREQIDIGDWDTAGSQPRARWVAGKGVDAPKPRRVWAVEREAA